MDDSVTHTAPGRHVSAVLAVAVPLLAMAWVLALPQRAGLMIFPQQMVALMLGLSLAVCFLRPRPGTSLGLLDRLLAAASLALAAHVFIRFPVLSERAWDHPVEAATVGVAVILLVMEGLRRVIGITLIIIFAALVLYAVAGQWVPGALQGRPQPIGDVLQYLGTDSSATWGQSLQIAAFVVVLFVLFAAFLMGTGGSDFFSSVAGRISGKGPGGSAKVAVTASGLTGMISGSAVSNVMTTGVITIPVMKRAGFSATHASAIEAVASTGGQLMPPIMGAAAFLMAEFLQVPYRDIIVAAALPALLYFLSLYIQIDFIARRDRLPSAREEVQGSFASILLKGWVSLVAIVALMGGIFGFDLAAEISVVYATLIIVALALVAWALKLSYGAMSPRQVLAALIEAGRSTCDVLLICAAAGMIIGLMTLTGLGFTLSYYLMSFGSESMFLLLLLSAVIGVVLGLGLPTTAVYLLLATLAAPALVQLGIPPMSAHMFLLYYGMLSMITPPIAIAAYAAASIGGADQYRTGFAAFLFGWASYILPFYFIYKPGLLMDTSWMQSAYVFVSTAVSLALIAGGVLGHGHKALSLAQRALWVLLGIAVIIPLSQMLSPLAEYGVAAAAAVVLGAHLLSARREAAPVRAEVSS
ncbi:TRAP transporter fused permease subunit [Salipiger manganoxidans]|uniref:TRAP transporter permease n=1 Tax=Salipiger marinus TaxID=555512 RepID=UPI001E63E0FC|nr:TRAP transporter fused permease subunit [Salipiger manganoxidans]MCD1618882.1 TRAP transporter fused permease subunit [Salipiger manganoxidans]